MTDFEYDILEHDWETLKAKYLLGKKYADVEQDILAFCELGYYYALFFYAPVYRVGENKSIDAIIDSFPDMSMQDIQYTMAYGKGEARALANRAYIKKMRKSKGMFRGLTKERGFELSIRSNAMSELGGTLGVADGLLYQLIRDYREGNGERADIRVLSGIAIKMSWGDKLDSATKDTIKRIAERPYSAYFDSYRNSRNISSSESGE